MKGGEAVDHLVARPGPVDGDQQVAAIARGYRGDRLVDELHMVGGGVGPGVPGPRQQRQALPGVVAPRRKWMKPKAALEVPCSQFLVGVGTDQGGVDADADHPLDVTVGGGNRGDLAVPGLNQRPHPTANLIACLGEPAHGLVIDLAECPPRRGGRGDGAEDPLLVTEGALLRGET